MATVNLGRIKPVFRGAYSGSTAYVVDDIVTHSDETYICIQAHGAGTQAVTQTAYWTKMAAKGTNGTDGTDLTTTLTTQGDLVYRDGSGLQRLGAGTSGQVLQTGGTGANPSWGTVSSDYVLLHTVNQTSGVTSLSIDGYFDSAYENYKLIISQLRQSGSRSADNQMQMRFNVGGVANSGSTYHWTLNESYVYSGGSNVTNRSTIGDSLIAQFQGTWQKNDTAFDQSASEITLFRPQNTNAGKLVKWILSYTDSNTVAVSTEGAASFNNLSATTGVTFYQGNNNAFTMRAKLYGIK